MTTENFADLLDESFGGSDSFEGSVVTGTVLSVDSDAVLVDVGLKSEGRIPMKEFGVGADAQVIAIGDSVDVFVERYEDRDGMIRLSREDFEDPHELAKHASTAGVSPEEFEHQFRYLVDFGSDDLSTDGIRLVQENGDEAEEK